MDQRLAVFDEKMGKTMNNLAEEFGGIRADAPIRMCLTS